MRLTICLTAALVLNAGSTLASAHPTHAKTAFQLNDTSWTFTDTDGTKVRESIDPTGNYIMQTAAGKHLDHGTAVMKGDKACFTSAMTKEGENCWTTNPTSIGRALHTVNDKGKKLTVTRVAYTPLEMPK